MKGFLLLISEKKEDATFLEGISEITQLPVKTVNQASVGIDLFSQQEVAALFVDTSNAALYEQFENHLQEKVGLFADYVFPNNFHFLAAQELSQMSYLIKSPLFGNYILRDMKSPKESGQHYGRLVRWSFMQKTFGLENFFLKQVTLKNFSLKTSQQKQATVEEVKNDLISLGFSIRLATLISNAVDELLMNAIFDAPVDDSGSTLFSKTARSESFLLTGQQKVELKMGFDGSYVALSVSDQFGSLNSEKLLSHLSKLYTFESYQVRSSLEGAGIGLATVFYSGGSFLFASEQGKRTEVTVFFKKENSMKNFRNQFRFISTQFYGNT